MKATHIFISLFQPKCLHVNIAQITGNSTFLSSRQNTVIDPNNEMSYTMWKDVPVPFFMSVYFFHVLNTDEILEGKKPKLEQRGPYVYRYV